MNRKITLYLAAPPDRAGSASKTAYVSLMGYRIGRSFHLYRMALPHEPCRLMDVDCTGFSGYGPHSLLIDEIMCECAFCGYYGIVMDLDRRKTAALEVFASRLAAAAAERGIALYLPEEYASVGEKVHALLFHGLRGGFREYLSRSSELFGADRLAVVIDCSYVMYCLSSAERTGSVLSEEHFSAVCAKHSPVFRYSPELCVNYITYKESGKTYLVFWDDERSVNEKLSAAEAVGVRDAFLFYPQVSGFIENIARR